MSSTTGSCDRCLDLGLGISLLVARHFEDSEHVDRFMCPGRNAAACRRDDQSGGGPRHTAAEPPGMAHRNTFAGAVLLRCTRGLVPVSIRILPPTVVMPLPRLFLRVLNCRISLSLSPRLFLCPYHASADLISRPSGQPALRAGSRVVCSAFLSHYIQGWPCGGVLLCTYGEIVSAALRTGARAFLLPSCRFSVTET